ncbi:hypothetical protein ACYOEI_30615, partial [Singulisphaera rosea]
MSLNAQAGRRIVPRALLLGIVAVSTAFSRPAAAKLETWRQETSAAFSKGHRERIVVAENGRVRLAQS